MKELYLFVKKNAQACIFGALILLGVLVTQYVPLGDFHRYDVIFIYVVLLQVGLILTKAESPKEIRVILLFHIVATLMELFKTSRGIGSWSYPHVEEAYFRLLTVPLFTGFLYSAVGSYIARATRLFDMKYVNFPKPIYVGALALAIYINFFTHHFVYDFRYILLLIIGIMFWNTHIYFVIDTKVRRMPFILAGFLTAFFVWIAENIASYSNVWLYPDQLSGWKMVSLHKIPAWFLLLIISFLMVSLVYQERLIQRKK